MDDIGAIASSGPSKGMKDLYQKINKYIYELRMMELDECLYGMNRTKIDKEKAYDIIIDAHDSESNPLILFWKARLTDPKYWGCKSSRVEKNKSRATALYEMAVELDIKRMAENGDKYACTCLGRMHRHGRGVIENYPKALKWYRKAAEQGHADAQFDLGEMYFDGFGFVRNYSTAVQWYHKAAEQGHAGAQLNLGEMYFEGFGVDENNSTAMEWYCKAAEQGHSDAQYYLDRSIYYSTDTGSEEE